MATTLTRVLQQEMLSATRRGQEIMIEAIRTWVDAVQSFTPQMPTIPVPFADRLPTPEDIVANAYDVAEQLLSDQRKFAEEIVTTAAPLLPASVRRTPAVS
jgi:hypothetical protein